ncbi:ATP-binding cassette domain-containing protein [Candidatus Collierbacteria bacterium]|nr:ATP-binding cassette domain-containing protein [Candidatus Collierbacteria bacterium]
MIRFASVTKTFPNGKTALKQISFEIADGEMVGIIGPSGSGKTTILRLLINEIIPTEGEISVDDFQVHKLNRKKLPQLRRTIGSVFQDYKILTDRTVAENVGLILEILDLPDKEIAEKVTNALEMVGLSKTEDLFPAQLSGGELQRVAIARAMAMSPKILFADEPTGNLDSVTAKQISKILKEINGRGTTVIIATHDKGVLDFIKPRILQLEAGELIL